MDRRVLQFTRPFLRAEEKGLTASQFFYQEVPKDVPVLDWLKELRRSEGIYDAVAGVRETFARVIGHKRDYRCYI